MKYRKYILLISGFLLLSLGLSSCTTAPKHETTDMAGKQAQAVGKSQAAKAPVMAPSLPVAYQRSPYIVDNNATKDLTIAEESKLKVGARITSTRGPQPLWDIVKRLASLKGMNVSWASDVDKNVLVDVDINANDDFYEALDNMLRQVDYYHEMHDNTIVIKYKETRQFQIAMPFTKQTYSTGTGGNLLGNTDSSNNVDGSIELKSKGNEFDIWDNIKLNLDTILQIWTFRREGETVQKDTDKVIDANVAKEGSRSYSGKQENAAQSEKTGKNDAAVSSAKSSGNVAGGKGFYIIDKPVGLITVTAPRPLMEKVDAYITALKKSLYQQISIEAKIIEVQLNDSSSIGINWTDVLKDFDINGLIRFGNNGVITAASGATTDISGVVYPGTGSFISNITLANKSFDVLLNALKTQGNTKILSNPRISVMNGQPALISVGKNVTYIDSIESERSGQGADAVTTFTVNTERILSGLGMSLTATILDKNDIIMNLVPITSELEEPIQNLAVGNQGDLVGLPVVNVREMSTTVKVKGGDMLVIGGLISETTKSDGEFAPGLGNVPILKYLFGHEDKTHIKSELIILLRPQII